ncbi:MAG: hypothetical protein K0R18_874 [Bacillales bacterium]|jgi:hypothetical protein|nr:hypothetical protein [Bacillales bacterium]
MIPKCLSGNTQEQLGIQELSEFTQEQLTEIVIHPRTSKSSDATLTFKSREHRMPGLSKLYEIDLAAIYG